MRQGCVLRELQVQTILEDFRLEHQPKDKDFPRAVCEILGHINEVLFDSSLNVRSLKLHCRLRDNNVSSRFR